MRAWWDEWKYFALSFPLGTGLGVATWYLGYWFPVALIGAGAAALLALEWRRAPRA